MIKTSGAMIYFNTVRFPWATLYDTFLENYIIIDRAKLKNVWNKLEMREQIKRSFHNIF